MATNIPPRADTLPVVTLNDGLRLPMVGLGVFGVPPEDTERTVTDAFESGYRSIDTASLYGNETEVGRAVQASNIPRSEIIVTTKIWNDCHGAQLSRRSTELSLERLGIDYVDLLLIHWPMPTQALFLETWETMEVLKNEGLVRSIGVSNFEPAHLQQILDLGGSVPSVNQVEMHPYLSQSRLRSFHDANGIVSEAWSPLARGRRILDDPTIGQIAREVGATPAQVVLRWHVDRGTVVLPRSSNPQRRRENIDLMWFELQNTHRRKIDELEVGWRIGPHPNRD